MTGTEGPPTMPPESSSRGHRKWLVATLAVLVVLGAAFATYVAIAFGGEDFGPYPVIENRTDQTIEILQEDSSGARKLHPRGEPR